MLGQLIVAVQYLRVAPLYGRYEFLLNVHVLTKLCVAGSHGQPLQDMLHVGISIVEAVIDVQHLAVLALLVALVEDAKHFV